MTEPLLQIMDKAFEEMLDISILFEVVEGRFKFLRTNKAGYAAGFKKEYHGKFIDEVLPPQLSLLYYNALKEIYIFKKSVKVKDPIVTTDGKVLGDMVLTPIFNSVETCTHVLGIGRDITGIKQKEEELVQTKAFLESILSSATDGILVTDTNLNVLRMNKGFTSLFGWHENEAAGFPLNKLKLVPPEYKVDHQKLIAQLSQGKNVPSYRTIRQGKNGQLIPVSTSYSALKGNNEKIIGFLGIYRDITEQVENERKVEETKQRYQSLVVNHPDAVFEFDINGIFTGANHMLEHITGYKIDELVNHSFVPIMAPDKLKNTLENFNDAVRGNTRNYESAVYNKSGERVDLDVTNVPIVVDGEITGVFGVAKNITEQKQLQNELIQTKETLESFFKNTIDAIDIVDLNGRITNVNPAFESMFGYAKDEVIGEKISIIMPENDLESDRLFQSVLEGNIINGLEVVRYRKDGSPVDVSISLSPIRNEKGIITSIAAITRNISEKKQSERRIQESESRYRLIAENMTDLISIIDVDSRLLYVSPSHKTVLGEDFKEGDELSDEVFHEEDHPRVLKEFQRVIETKEQRSIEYRIRHVQGYFIWLDTKIIPVFNEENKLQHILCISRDITERKKYEEKLEKMAFYDYLTGIANRRLFMDRLHYTVVQSERDNEAFAIMSLDFDRFKWVNDTLGHDVGDELLVQFVRRVKTCIRQVDTLARLGGDEFAILLPGISSIENIEIVAQRILETLQKPWRIKGNSFITTSSIGISMYSSCGEDIPSLMKHADQSLYKAKQSGRNTYFICSHTVEFPQLNSNDLFKEEINRAIQCNEFYLVYQPKFHLNSQKIVAIEALIRWEHPEKGLITPDEFISRAEETDLIIPITHWVLEQVGRQIKKWNYQNDWQIPVAVNISAKHFDSGTLVSDIVKITKATGIDPQSFIIEITESTMIRNMDKTVQTLLQLKELGVKIAIDDFGTGYSSLSYLMKLNVDILKLDKTFIQELTSQKNASIVHSIVSLAHNLNLNVVAEGIETETQCQILDQCGCDIGQGYFFSKPLTGEQLEKVFFS